MTSKKLRTLRIGESTTSLRFTPGEWEAIESAAAASGMKWPEWARSVIESNPTATNRTSLLRRASREIAFDKAMWAERIEDLQIGRSFAHPMLQGRFWPISKENLHDDLALWRIDRRLDFGAFEVIAGYRSEIPAMIVRSKLEDDLNALFLRDPLPQE